MKTMTPVVDLGVMLTDYVQQSGGHPAAVIGARMANEVLVKVAKRAIELNDEALISSLKSICYIKD